MKRLRDILYLSEMATVSFPLRGTLTKMNDQVASISTSKLRDYTDIGHITLGGREHRVVRSNPSPSNFFGQEYTFHVLYPDRRGIRGSNMSAMTLHTEKFDLPTKENAITMTLVKKHKDANHFKAADVYSWLAKHGHLSKEENTPSAERGLAIVSDTIMSPATQANYHNIFKHRKKYGLSMSWLHPTAQEEPITKRHHLETGYVYRSTDPAARPSMSTSEILNISRRRIVLRAKEEMS